MSASLSLAYIGLGSNLGDRRENLRRAVKEIAATPGVRLLRLSSLYLTSPWGKEDQPWFLNAVAAVETSLAPEELLFCLQEIERRMGRVRAGRWGPRNIDLDLLLYGALAIETPTLTLPHPRLKERLFVVLPLAEVAPELVLPGGERVSSLVVQLKEGEQKVFLIGKL